MFGYLSDRLGLPGVVGNEYWEEGVEDALDTLGQHLVCGGCRSSSSLIVMAQNDIFGVKIKCRACWWGPMWVEPTMEEGW